MSYRKIVLYIIVLTILSNLALAVPPVTQLSQVGSLDIAYPQYPYVAANNSFVLNIHVQNSTNYITDANCYLDLYNIDGSETCNIQLSQSGREYSGSITAGNFSSYGYHSFIIECNTTTQAGFANGVFEVTKLGIEIDEARSLLILGLLVIIFLVSYFMAYLSFKLDQPPLQIFFIGLAWLFLYFQIQLTTLVITQIVPAVTSINSMVSTFLIIFNWLTFFLFVVLFVYLLYHFFLWLKEYLDIKNYGRGELD